jgi:hypothetical protein
MKLTAKKLRQIIQEEISLTEQVSAEDAQRANAYIDQLMNELMVGLSMVASGELEVRGEGRIQHLNDQQKQDLSDLVGRAFERNRQAFRDAVAEVVIQVPVGAPEAGDEEA